MVRGWWLVAGVEWDRIKAIFQEALERAPSERATFLDAACAGEPALRAEVESLLASHDAAGTFLETPAAAGAGPILVAADPASFAGRIIGPYRIEREIGGGGMGRVYLAARADDVYRKKVAIKIIKRGMDTDEIVRRFHHERRTLANLDHPNIARILDGGTTEEGLPYFVMDYVEGVPLDTYRDERRPSLDERLRLFRTICDAVQYAHQNLVVHRDLKPDNILVTADGQPRLVDFGIAKVLAEERGEGSYIETRPAERLMTLPYASPEQLRGGPITTASDVYALGVLLYELLTDRHPFRIDGRRPDEIERAICEEDPPRPSAVAPTRELRRRLAGDLDVIVLMAMRKEPDRRYQSARQLAEDLRRFAEGLPVMARRDSVAYRAAKFVGRHKLGVAAAGLVLATLAAGVAGIAWQARVAAGERDRARAAAEKAQQILSVMQEMLQSPDPTLQGRDVTVAQMLDEAAARIARDFAAQPEIRAALQTTIGTTYLALGLYEHAEAQLSAALATRRALFGADHLDVAATRTELSSAQAATGRFKEAEQGYREALAIYDRLGVRDDLQRATTLDGLGLLLRETARDQEAERQYREALRIRRARLGPEHPDVAGVLNNLAVIAQSRADLDEAESLYREALAIVRKARGDNHPGVGAALSNLAGVLAAKGDNAAAEPLYQEALAVRRRVLGDDHPDVTFTLVNYAVLLQAEGRLDEAIAICREVLARRGRSLPEGHAMVSATLIVLGASLTDAGRPRDGEVHLREALALREQALPPDHWLIANTKSLLGGALTKQKRFREAEPLVVSGYERLLADRGPRHERTRDALRRVIELYTAWGKPDKAAIYRAHLGGR